MEAVDPEPIIVWLEDGTVRIEVGDQVGWVSSSHLIDPKVKQLIKSHNRAQSLLLD